MPAKRRRDIDEEFNECGVAEQELPLRKQRVLVKRAVLLRQRVTSAALRSLGNRLENMPEKKPPGGNPEVGYDACPGVAFAGGPREQPSSNCAARTRSTTEDLSGMMLNDEWLSERVSQNDFFSQRAVYALGHRRDWVQGAATAKFRFRDQCTT